MDPATLSADLVALLAPLLPRLTDVSTVAAYAAADQIGQRIGQAAVQRSTALWDRLWPRLRDRSAARQAVTAIAKNPDAKDARDALTLEVAALLAHDPELARETATLLRHVGVANNVGRITISGDRNVVQTDGPNISIGRAHNVQFHDRSET